MIRINENNQRQENIDFCVHARRAAVANVARNALKWKDSTASAIHIFFGLPFEIIEINWVYLISSKRPIRKGN